MYNKSFKSVSGNVASGLQQKGWIKSKRSLLYVGVMVAMASGQAHALDCSNGEQAGAVLFSSPSFADVTSDYTLIGNNSYPGGEQSRSVYNTSFQDAYAGVTYTQAPHPDYEFWQYTNGNGFGDVDTKVLSAEVDLSAVSNNVLVSVQASNVLQDLPGVIENPQLFLKSGALASSVTTLPMEDTSGAGDVWTTVSLEIPSSALSANTVIELWDQARGATGDDLAVAGFQVQECGTSTPAPITGTIEVAVNLDGNPIEEEVLVSIKDANGNIVADGLTSGGAFTSGTLPDGVYTVTISGNALTDTTGTTQAENVAEGTTSTFNLASIVKTAGFDLAAEGLTEVNANNGAYYYGAPAVNTPVSKSFTIFNPGDASLNVGSIVLAVGAPFALDADTCTSAGTGTGMVAAGGDCMFTVTYTPTVAIDTPMASDTVTVTYDDGVYNLALTGQAVDNSAPVLEVTDGDTVLPAGNYSLDLGSVVQNGVAPVGYVVVTNKGDADLELLTETTGSPFAYTTNSPGLGGLCGMLPRTLGPMEACKLAYTMTTASVGSFSDTSVITTNATPSSFTVDLTGVVGDKDTDGDGLFDLEEAGLGTDPNKFDTDGDGLSDGQEVNSLPTDPLNADTDGDGEKDGAEVGGNIDAPLDTDGDSIIDALEPSNVDTDRDGRPNENDADDDADGIMTKDEAVNSVGGLLDTDGDTVPDYLESNILNTDGDNANNHLDANDDGEAGLTSTEVGGDYFRPIDTDGDNIPDYLDADNGASNDSDKDGIMDTQECSNGFPQCDFIEVNNADGSLRYQLPLYMTTRTVAVTPEAVVPTADEPIVETGLEGGVGGGGAAGGALLSFLGLGYGLRRRKSSRANMAAAVAVATTAMMMSVPQTSEAAEGDWYIGAGGGITKVKPDTNGTLYSIDDSISQGFKGILGYDLTDNWSVEAFLADLGEAKLNPTGTIDYQMGGLGAIYNHLLSEQYGVTGLLKLGVAGLSNDSDGVPYRRVEDTQLFAGIGLEKAFSAGLSLRGEFEYFDKDIRFASLNLIKRFGEEAAPVPAPVPVVVAPLDSDGDTVIDDRDECPQTPPGTEVDVRGCTFVADEVVDSDGDGITDARDQCMNTPAGTRVDDTGCPVVQRLTGVLEGVNFDTDSDNLTGEARLILDHLAVKLNQYDDVELLLVGHTDDQASDSYNKKLSFDRAKAVASYLVSRGVSAKRMRFIGMGESQPRASNASAEGRARNRRVELIAK